MSRLSASLCLDDAGLPVVQRPQRNGDAEPFVFVYIDRLALWSTRPTVLRQLASALTEAADTLDAFTRTQDDDQARDLDARMKAEAQP